MEAKKIIIIGIIISVVIFILLEIIPPWQVAHFGITNPKDLVDAENSYRVTLFQILGGITILTGIYFAWRNLDSSIKNAQENSDLALKNLKIAQDTLKSN